MSLSAQDIIALARAGYNAEQISAINAEANVSTVSTETTEPTESTESTELSTQDTVEPVKVQEPILAEKTEKPMAPAIDPTPTTPTMQDLMAKLASMENRLQGAAIKTDQQPGQQGPLTGQDVLARILDPTIE